MSNLFQKTITLLTGSPDPAISFKMPKRKAVKKLTERDLLRLESQIGSQLFGPIPDGHTREFFCLDETTWIWYEQWRDQNGVSKSSTTRYEVHPKGVLKVLEGARYTYIEGQELDNLLHATRLYYEKVARDVYHRDPQTGLKLA